MSNRKEFNSYIKLYGTQKDIDHAVVVLNDNINSITGSECPDRVFIQGLIDSKSIKASILYNGNSITPFKKTITDLKRILNAGDMNKMTDHLYKVLSLQCGSIAHYNKAGWIDTYPTVQSLARFFRRNEFGNNIYFDCPQWKADFKVVAKEMLRLTEKLV